ncbi:MAG: glutamate-5-semialdehyde dehydrogenase [Kiritimatiellae bacterium]|nr:glutamate-5-semialdehyde dehydrogenase [Kiritimatiellia bacterium]
MTLHDEMAAIGSRAVVASRRLALLGSGKKNAILESMAEAIEARKDAIKEANARDLEAAKQAGLSAPMLERLALTDARVAAMARGLREIAALKDPVGRTIRRWERPNGLRIVKRRVPIGVIAIIYESRPSVTADAAGLCIKTANAVILRGGKEALLSNQAIVNAMTAAGGGKGLPADAIQLVTTTDREAVRALVGLEGLIDLVMPRGGEQLIRAVVENAKAPVIKHYKGVCHIYVDENAHPEMALKIIENAKCQRPSVCNAVEKVLVHEKTAGTFIPLMAEKLSGRGVELRGDEAACALAGAIKPAVETDWSAEYLDLVLAVKVVKSVREAIEHINHYGSHHSDAIITESARARKMFLEQVDSAVVYVNASTRFTDGGEFGMGAEIGISTDKLHARGPMGLEELTAYKYQVLGSGQVRK